MPGAPRGRRGSPPAARGPALRHRRARAARSAGGWRGRRSAAAAPGTAGPARPAAAVPARSCRTRGRPGCRPLHRPARAPAADGRSRCRTPAGRRGRSGAATPRCARSTRRGR
ncbi:hypothetical protein G6F65_010124 [Rhizopus arrhizus]|nr:hypothetical protein G6F65_010124 [Rhizopus arrhizus]